MVRPLTTGNLLTLFLVLVAGGLSVFALRSYQEWRPESTFESIPENVDLTLKNIKYTKTRDGEPLWTLVADSADHSMDDDITRIANVRMVFFDPKMGDIVLTADQGELIPEKRTVKVRSNVKIISPPGNIMLTEFLEYNESTNILHTDKEVRLNFDYFEAIGKGMQMDVENRNLLLLSNVKALLGS
jgi:LPS export ABC transporter protein LptC